MSAQGYGLHVVSVLEDHSYELNEKILEQVLLKPEIKDLPVVVVSVAGAYRGGKSFLLNFFLRYLVADESAQQDGSWLGEDSAPLAGFDWRGGVERHTTGILLWSEPFIVTLASGEKVAVLLMDTQGTFDSKSTVRDNSTIFALSTLISSVQIYNLSMNIQEDDLQHLQLFTMYGKMVQEKNDRGKAFQTLGFLVRDWPFYEDYSYGADGGNLLLHDRLKVTPKQPEELRELRKHLRSCFEDVFCFLMPHPGFKVQNMNFKGNIQDIELNFREHLIELVSSLFNTKTLCPKTINGQRIKAGELYNYFKAYMTLFNSDEIPNPKSIVQATVEAGLLSALNEARQVYDKQMSDECGPAAPSMPTGDVQELHRKCLDKAREAFTSKRTMASHTEVNKQLEILIKGLDDRLPQFEQSNLSKLQATIKQASDIYEDVINNISKHQPLCLHPEDLETVHNETVQSALALYDTQVKKISDKPDQKRSELVQTFQSRLVQLTILNDNNNKAVVKNLFMEYQNIMGTHSRNPPLSSEDFKAGHEEALKQTVGKIETKRNRTNHYPNDVYRDELEKIVMDAFWQLQAINQGKIEQEIKRQEEERIRREEAQAKIDEERALREQETAKLNQEREKMDLEKQRLEQDKQRLEIENEKLKNSNNNSILGTVLGAVTRIAETVITKTITK